MHRIVNIMFIISAKDRTCYSVILCVTRTVAAVCEQALMTIFHRDTIDRIGLLETSNRNSRLTNHQIEVFLGKAHVSVVISYDWLACFDRVERRWKKNTARERL
ncbi:hypothetical protein GE061_004589 [Apolygus lucorum]|uniref:Uncharacterized protein n=1 Tax=Apolygus lucorum TaxID=248454 RepID=A0A8S9X1K1_APOLU|nr:hypothetical protein GE061_004589 [Apolygus lucorum]